MHSPAAIAGNAPYEQAPHLPTLARMLSLLGLLALALWWGPVAAGSALSPAAGSTGPTASMPAHVPGCGQRLPQEFERGSELFGKRRIARNGDWAPPALPLLRADALPVLLALRVPTAIECTPAWKHGADDALPPRDHRRLLTERYPPQAPPLA